jgi:hypothetical protein
MRLDQGLQYLGGRKRKGREEYYVRGRVGRCAKVKGRQGMYASGGSNAILEGTMVAYLISPRQVSLRRFGVIESGWWERIFPLRTAGDLVRWWCFPSALAWGFPFQPKPLEIGAQNEPRKGATRGEGRFRSQVREGRERILADGGDVELYGSVYGEREGRMLKRVNFFFFSGGERFWKRVRGYDGILIDRSPSRKKREGGACREF